jgi:hypothetical protein
MTELKQWLDKGSALAEQHTTQKWALADWLAAGDTAWGGIAYDHALSLFPDLNRKYLIQIAYTARNVTDTVRQYKLSFGHHELVAGLEPTVQDRLLKRAVEEQWTCGKLRHQLKDVEHAQEFSLAVSADLFKQLNEFSKLVNVSPAALLTTAVTQFLQSPPEDLKQQYETALLAQRERYQQQQAERAVRDAEWSAQQAEQKRVEDERALFIHDSSIAVRQIDERHSPVEVLDALKTLRDMVNRAPRLPIADLQEQLDIVLALAKPPEPAPTQEEQVTATV